MILLQKDHHAIGEFHPARLLRSKSVQRREVNLLPVAYLSGSQRWEKRQSEQCRQHKPGSAGVPPAITGSFRAVLRRAGKMPALPGVKARVTDFTGVNPNWLHSWLHC